MLEHNSISNYMQFSNIMKSNPDFLSILGPSSATDIRSAMKNSLICVLKLSASKYLKVRHFTANFSPEWCLHEKIEPYDPKPIYSKLCLQLYPNTLSTVYFFAYLPIWQRISKTSKFYICWSTLIDTWFVFFL